MAFWSTRFEVGFSLCLGSGSSIANAVFLLHVLLGFLGLFAMDFKAFVLILLQFCLVLYFFRLLSISKDKFLKSKTTVQ